MSCQSSHIGVYYADLVAIYSNEGKSRSPSCFYLKNKYNPLRPSAPHMRHSAKILISIQEGIIKKIPMGVVAMSRYTERSYLNLCSKKIMVYLSVLLSVHLSICLHHDFQMNSFILTKKPALNASGDEYFR